MKDKIEALRVRITEANAAYYEKDEPFMTDSEYDALMRELRAYEAAYPEYDSADSPTHRVGGRAGEAFSPVTHRVALDSLQDVFDKEELYEFDKRVQPVTAGYVLESKIDGLSVAVEYKGGVLYRAATRGDGRTGEDVTHNIRTVAAIPAILKGAPERVVVRGEVFMPREVFIELNAEREAAGETPLANPRNAAAGSLRQLDPAVAASRRLDALFFNVQEQSGAPFGTHMESLSAMRSWGLPVNRAELFENMDEVAGAIEALGDRRSEFPFDMDGAVVKLNSMEDRSRLGSTSRAPRWAVAFKYPPEVERTRLCGIEIQVGRTGVLTPRAILEPVKVSGTTVSYASLHNRAFIESRDIRIGDFVLVRKAGEIIPEIIASVAEERPEGTERYVFPDKCPCCGGDAIEDGAALRCVNERCPERLSRAMEHFVSRDAMDIQGCGSGVIAALISSGLACEPCDLYTLRQEELLKLEGFAEKSAAALTEAVEASKKQPLARLLYAFGIRHVGRRAALLIAGRFGSLEAVAAAELREIAAIHEIGPQTAQSLSDWLSKNTETIERVKALGLNTQHGGSGTGGALTGKTIVITGSFEGYTRTELAALIEAHGGRVSGSVSKKTDFLLCGAEAGSKLEKAQKLGIAQLELTGLLELVRDRAGA